MELVQPSYFICYTRRCLSLSFSTLSEEMFPGLEYLRMHWYFLHLCRELRDVPDQTGLIEFEGLETVEELAN